MCAASPTRNRRPNCIGSATKLRMGVIARWKIGPSSSVHGSSRAKPRPKLAPNLIVGPVLDPLVRRALEVQSRDGRGSHAHEREAALVTRVHQFFRRRSRRRKYAEPSERIFLLIEREDAGRNRRATNAVKTVAAGDDVAVESLRVVRHAGKQSPASSDDTPSSATSLASNTMRCPSASAAAIRSLMTSCCP